jgi:hypothetical protein
VGGDLKVTLSLSSHDCAGERYLGDVCGED